MYKEFQIQGRRYRLNVRKAAAAAANTVVYMAWLAACAGFYAIVIGRVLS